MYKKKYTMFYFSVTSCLIAGCFGSGLNDWRYELPNNYEMWHINSSKIVVGLRDSNYSLKIYDSTHNLIGIPAHIIYFAYTDRYVYAKTINPDDVNSFKNSYSVKIFFYVVDTKNRKSYGPFSNEMDFPDNLVINNLNWIATRPPPEGIFYKRSENGVLR
jgi:hypothetical protein